jgi:zinc transport system ATP-binding protein
MQTNEEELNNDGDKRFVICFDDVGLRLGNTEILHDVSFAVEHGSIHCIVGPNGGGKSSAIKCLLGQMPHTGQVTIDDELSIIGYVPQRFEFDVNLPVTVSDFMLAVIQSKPIFIGKSADAIAPVMEALSRVGMEDRVNQRLGSLSGGQRQRILFAQALVPSPSILIMDEPMTGIDEMGRKTILEEMVRLKESGTSILWIHHELQEVFEFADCITCIDKTVTYSGPPETVISESGLQGLLSFVESHQANPAQQQ